MPKWVWKHSTDVKRKYEDKVRYEALFIWLKQARSEDVSVKKNCMEKLHSNVNAAKKWARIILKTILEMYQPKNTYNTDIT